MPSIFLSKLLPRSMRFQRIRQGIVRRVVGSLLAGSLSFMSLALFSGCSKSATEQAKAGPITMTDISGKAQSSAVLGLAAKTMLSMTPTGDTLNAGVDWSVTCGGNPVTGSVTNGACGSLSPAHTASGAQTSYTAPSIIPIGATVTITATLTSNPSQSSSLILTVVGTPIAVALTKQPPSSLTTNATFVLMAQVSNDPTGAGLYWTATCGSAACGSFSATQGSPTTYTAPASVPDGGNVTITATSVADTTKSASASLSIVAPPAVNPLTVSIVPASLNVQTSGSARSVRFIAIVGNDPSLAGVDWSVSCSASSCGTITSHSASGATATYLGPTSVPLGGTATITAKSTTDPTVSATATANIVKTAPVVVTISSAPPASLMAGTTATLAARVTSDPKNLGVDWTATCGTAGACGSFNLSPAHTASGAQIVYTAPSSVPAGGIVLLTASSPTTSAANPAVALTSITAQPPSLTFTQAPPVSMAALAQAPVSATVANDVLPGGVTWSVQCGSTVPGDCGWITPSQTASGATAIYTAPPSTTSGTAVTIQATSVALPSVSISSNAIAINPDTTLSVSFVPFLPSQLTTDGTTNLTAAVAHDATDAGVDWQVCASGCGFFTVKPATPAIPATDTTPYVPPVAAVTATSVSGWPSGLPIPYTAPSSLPQSGFVTILAASHADATKAMSGNITINTVASGPQLNGVVQAGIQPVVGASVSLYVAGTSGYASAASQIASATTDKNGSFAVPGGYSCAPDGQMYVVASGGKVGSNSTNPSLALMTALGPCSGLSSSPMVVNEVTSVASAFALAPFSANDALTGNNSYLYLGTSSGNLSGLANAFASVNNLVDLATGKVRYVTPAGNAAVPYATINTLADMLNACTNTPGGVEGDGSPCGNLFTATDVVPSSQHQTYNAIAPTDTLQAVFNIAQHPVTNYGYQLDPAPQQLLSLATSNSAFLPVLLSQPNDWSLSLNYTRGGGLSSSSSVGSFSLDAGGNLWITDTKAGSVIEWNPTGAAISPSTGFAAGGGPIAIDASGNVWVSGNGVLTELTSLGSPAQGSPFVGVASGGTDMAIDTQSNLWIANGTGVSEFTNSGVAVSPVGGFTNDGITGISSIGVDSSNNVWVGNGGSSNFAELTNPGGQLLVNSVNQAQSVPLPQLVADGSGNLWGVTTNGGQLCKVPAYGGKGSTLQPNCTGEATDTNSVLRFYAAQGVAIDGNGTVWLASKGGGTLSVLPSLLPIAPSILADNTPTYLASTSLAAGPLRVAVDGSGNVWVLLADNSVTEYVGLATPVVTPIALGVKNKKLGAKP